MKVAIVGCGFIADKHAAAIRNIEGAQLVAVCDKVPAAMERFVEEFWAEPFQDIEVMLDRVEVDVVCVCTPSGLHAPIAIRAAEAGKHLVVEKPVAMSLEDTEAMRRACKENGVKMAVVHPNRFRPVVQELKKILDEGHLGKISHVSCIVNWNRGQAYYDQAPWRGTKAHDGGVLMNQAIHNLDLLLWFMGEPARLFSMEATRLRKIEAEDVSMGVIEFKSGALGSVEASTTVYPKNFEESITLFGENGTVKIGGTNALYFEHLDINGWTTEEVEKLKEKVKDNPWGTPGHQRILEDMMLAIRENREPAVTAADGERVLRLVLEFYRSAELRMPLDWDPGMPHDEIIK